MTDLFCGANGSGLGATAVPGVQFVMAANQWQVAIDTHMANFPDSDHDCADISQVDPRRYRRTDKREQVCQLGNVVTPPAAEWLIRAVVSALGGD